MRGLRVKLLLLEHSPREANNFLISICALHEQLKKRPTQKPERTDLAHPSAMAGPRRIVSLTYDSGALGRHCLASAWSLITIRSQ
jgi:hypothetical protein